MKWVIKQREWEENESAFYRWRERRSVLKTWCCEKHHGFVAVERGRVSEQLIRHCCLTFSVSCWGCGNEAGYSSGTESHSSAQSFRKTGKDWRFLGFVGIHLVFTHLIHCFRVIKFTNVITITYKILILYIIYNIYTLYYVTCILYTHTCLVIMKN